MGREITRGSTQIPVTMTSTFKAFLFSLVPGVVEIMSFVCFFIAALSAISQAALF
jgi:hypothetical protein